MITNLPNKLIKFDQYFILTVIINKCIIMYEITKCIICLENGDNQTQINENNLILPIPCECKIYCHQECFDKVESNVCFICKQPYDIEKYSETNCLKFTEKPIDSEKLVSFNEIIMEELQTDERPVINTRNGLCDYVDQLLKIIAFACIPALSLFSGILIVWINGMLVNITFCLFFNSLVKNCFLNYDDIIVFIVGLSSLTFWFMVYKIFNSKNLMKCCPEVCKNY